MCCLIVSGIVIVYTLRVNMSVAAQDMRTELKWTEQQKGVVLSSFYWGYALGQLPASCYVQIYGAKWIFGLSVIIPSLLTLLVPVVGRTSFMLLIALRVLIGFFESASFPAVYHFFPLWIPLDEKTVLIPFILSGMYLGEIVGFSLSGMLTVTHFTVGDIVLGGWSSVFYVFGVVGVLWFPLWAQFAYEQPNMHPGISDEELYRIQRGWLLIALIVVAIDLLLLLAKIVFVVGAGGDQVCLCGFA